MFDYTESKLDAEMSSTLKSLADRATSCGVESKDIIKYLFLDRILHDALRHLGFHLSHDDRESLIRHLIKCEVSSLKEITKEIGLILSKKKDPNTTHTYSLGLGKRAYPVGVDTAVYTGSKRNFPQLASVAATLVSSGLLEEDAIRRVISDLTLDDRIAFLSWYGLKYKSGRNLAYLCAEEDVLIKKVAYESDGAFIYEFYKHKGASTTEESTPAVQYAKDHRVDPLSAEEFKKMRDKMVGRTFAIDKLLEKYRHLLQEEQFDAIEDSLNILRKNIRRLKTATLKDVIEKVAFTVEQNDWFEGATLIRDIAASDERFVKTANLLSRPEDLDKVLSSLEEMSAFLRQRAIIRELSARDIDIFNLGFGHMPEIGDAAAKLMEAFNGSANKIDDLVGKLRAELQQQTNPKMAPRVVKTLVKPQDLPLVKALEPAPVAPPAGPQELGVPPMQVPLPTEEV